MSIPTLPFSKARRAGGLVFLAGELPFRPDGTIPEGIGPRTDARIEITVIAKARA